MSIVRYPGLNLNVFQRDIQREMNRLFDSFFPARKTSGGEEAFESAVWRPIVDVHEDDHSFIIDCELPGMKREDIRINFQDGTLSIAGERNYQYDSKNAAAGNGNGNGNGNGDSGIVKDKDKSAHRVERFYGRFHRSFTFPAAVNSDAIKASFDNGVLSIIVPKAEQVKPRLIEIG